MAREVLGVVTSPKRMATTAALSDYIPEIRIIPEDSDSEISKELPEGYGDFKLRSSDNVDIYFPGALLTGTAQRHQVTAITHKCALQLEEDKETLELLLRYVDSRKQPETITPQNVKRLLIAAEKCQVHGVARSVEDWLLR